MTSVSVSSKKNKQECLSLSSLGPRYIHFFSHSSSWRTNNVGRRCAFLQTIKVEHGAGGRRVPRHPRKSGCPSDGEDESQKPFVPQMADQCSRLLLFRGLALSPCLIIVPTWEWGCCFMLCVCVCARWLAWLECLAGKSDDPYNVWATPAFGWALGMDVHVHVERILEMFRRSSLVCWNKMDAPTLKLQSYASPRYVWIGSDWNRQSLAACWAGFRRKSICLPLLFHSGIAHRNTAVHSAHQQAGQGLIVISLCGRNWMEILSTKP